MRNRGTTIATVLLIIFIIILGFLSYVFFYNLKNPKVDTESFSNELNKMGETIYTDYYYEVTKVNKTDEEFKEYLGKFNKIGLQFNLVELSKYSEDNNNIISKFLEENKSCGRENTMVIIYPEEPYSKDDFTSEVRIDCKLKE